MDDLISRQAAIDKADSLYRDTKNDECYMITGYNHAISDIRAILKSLPSAQPERKTGHWIKTARWGRVYYCDQCRNYLDFDGVNVGRGSTNFCPNCGAKMDEEGKDD